MLCLVQQPAPLDRYSVQTHQKLLEIHPDRDPINDLLVFRQVTVNHQHVILRYDLRTDVESICEPPEGLEGDLVQGGRLSNRKECLLHQELE